jgi:hypothetical protein
LRLIQLELHFTRKEVSSIFLKLFYNRDQFAPYKFLMLIIELHMPRAFLHTLSIDSPFLYLIIIAPKFFFSFARVKIFFLEKAKTGIAMTLFMDWATY